MHTDLNEHWLRQVKFSDDDNYEDVEDVEDDAGEDESSVDLEDDAGKDVEDDDGEDESSVDVVSRAEERIVSQWREVSADEQHEMRQDVDKILQPLGSETRLVVMERVNGIAVLFICMTLAAVMNLRDHFRSRQLRDIIMKLFTVLSRATRTVDIKRLTWPVTQSELQSSFFSPVPGYQVSHC